MMCLNRTSVLFIFTILCRFFHVSLWYCQRYLAWIAHSWPPAQASESYYFETIHLEHLLNWCFSEGLSLLSLGLGIYTVMGSSLALLALLRLQQVSEPSFSSLGCARSAWLDRAHHRHESEGFPHRHQLWRGQHQRTQLQCRAPYPCHAP